MRGMCKAIKSQLEMIKLKKASKSQSDNKIIAVIDYSSIFTAGDGKHVMNGWYKMCNIYAHPHL